MKSPSPHPSPGIPGEGVSRINFGGMKGAARIGITYHRPRRGPWLQLFDFAGYEWNTVELALPELPAALDGVRMIHLTDLHLRTRWPKQLDEVIARINANPPDLILFTGDFVDDMRDHRPALPLVHRLITQLRAKSGVFAVLGNHDGDLLWPRLHALGVNVIVHRHVELNLNGRPIDLIGLPGPDRIDLDERFLASIPHRRPDVPRVVLSHYPDLIHRALPLRPDLFLAGHTHGGQICLPNQHAILTHDSLPGRLSKGVHDINGTCLIVGRGFGFADLPIRLFCPAEVIEIVLRTKNEG